jgi:mRNA interferase RelE/StbE
MNNLFFTHTANKEFNKLASNDKERVQIRLNKLAIPLPKSLNIKALTGLSGFFRLRVGSIRVVFEVDTKKRMIVIRSVGYRGNVYGKL